MTMVHASEVMSHNFIVTLNVVQVRFSVRGLEKGNGTINEHRGLWGLSLE